MSDVAIAPPGPILEFRRNFAASRSGVIGLVLVVLLVFAAVLAPLLAPHPPDEQMRTAILHPPTWFGGAFPLGTDDLGRDVFSRLLYGARLSLSIGAVVVTLAFAVGTMLGLVAGFSGGVVEALVMRLMDIMLALPTLLLAIAIVAVLGPGLFNAMLAVAIVQLPGFVRLTRAAVLVERGKDYVTASRMAGAGRMRLMFLIVLPNCLAPLIVQASLGFSGAILDTAALGVPRAWRAAAHAGMGHHARRRAAIRAERVVGGDVSGPGHPADGAGLQPGGRRAARRAGSAAEAGMSLLEIRNLHVTFPTARGTVARGRGRGPGCGGRRGARYRRGIRLGQSRLRCWR